MAPTTEGSAARTRVVLVDRPPNRPTPAIRGEERVLGIASGTQPSTTHEFTTPTKTPAMGRAIEQGVS